MQIQNFSTWLQERLIRSLPGEPAQSRMLRTKRPKVGEAPAGARESAVLVLLYIQHDRPEVVLIERISDGSVHSGQIAFPGGSREKSDADLTATALREAREEVALNVEDVRVLGLLTGLYIPVSNFRVYPVLAVAHARPFLYPSDGEVSRILYVPLPELFSRKASVSVQVAETVQVTMQVDAYLTEEHTIVWGATAMILSELEALWEEYLSEAGCQS